MSELAQDRIQRLFDAFGEVALDDPEMARDILVDAGRDPDRVARDGAEYVRKLVERNRGDETVPERDMLKIENASTQALAEEFCAKLKEQGRDHTVEMAIHIALIQALLRHDPTAKRSVT